LNKRKYNYNYFLGNTIGNYFVFAITATIGIENLKFGFTTPSAALNLSNVLSVGYLSLCGLMFIILTYLFIKAKYLKKNLVDTDLSIEKRIEFAHKLDKLINKYSSIFEGLRKDKIDAVFGYHYLQMIRSILVAYSVVYVKNLIF